MYKSLLACCLMLVCGVLCAAQQLQIDDKALARQRALAELGNLPAQIKAMDEPALRVFLRIRTANFLWAEGSKDASRRAEAIATEAVVEIQNHRSEMPSLYTGLFLRDLLAGLQLHAPTLAASLIKKYDLEKSGDRFDSALTLLNSKDGVPKAVEIIHNNFQSNLESFVSKSSFLFSRLDEIQPAETNRLLAEIIAAVQYEPSNYTLSILFRLAHLYVYREATPTELKSGYLIVLIQATRNGATLNQEDRTNAYNLLKATLPAIERLLPSLYAQASAQAAALASQIPKRTLERDAIENIIRNSSDPLDQMITEADSTEDEALRRELLARAAETALERGRLKLAVDLIMRNQGEDKKESILYRDQFLGEVVNHAIAEKDLTVADYAASKIDADLKRAAAMQNIALYVFKSKDVFGARDRLAGALKLINAADNGVEKASALFRSIPVYAKVDEQRVPDLIPAAIKVVNDLPGPKSEDKPDSESHKAYVNTLLQVAYNVIPAFRALAGTNENEAFYLAGTFQRQEIKTAAIFGAATGIRTPTSTIINTHPTPKPAPIKQQPQN